MITFFGFVQSEFGGGLVLHRAAQALLVEGLTDKGIHANFNVVDFALFVALVGKKIIGL